MVAVKLNNRYQIRRELGRGGFGQTFLAIDTHMPSGQQCAIKQLKPQLADPDQYEQARDRFQREAAILEALGRECDRIPRLLAYFAEAGSFYLVQEWVEGPTLAQLVQQQGPLPAATVSQILRDLLPVLACVHQHRIVHRDLKPDNVIQRASDDLPVLIDFGIVKESLETGYANGNSAYSVAIGTPGYMPPEQAAGRPVYASDLYSLAMTAVYLLSGRSPHSLETDERTGEVRWREAVPDLHGPLAMVLDRALQFQPRDRFASARDMLAALQVSRGPSAPRTTSAPTPVARPQPPGARRPAPQPQPRQTRHLAPPAPPEPTPWGAIFLTALAVIAAGAGTGIGIVQWLDGRSATGAGDSPPEVAAPEEPPVATFEPNLPVDAQPEAPEEPEEPEVAREPQPTPAPEPEPAPEPVPEFETVEPVASPRLFAAGTTEREIRNTLGAPTAVERDRATSTDYAVYKPVDRADLVYALDANSGSLRQTEVIFTAGTDRATARAALAELFGEAFAIAADPALSRVYAGQPSQTFATAAGTVTVEQRGQRLVLSF